METGKPYSSTIAITTAGSRHKYNGTEISGYSANASGVSGSPADHATSSTSTNLTITHPTSTYLTSINSTELNLTASSPLSIDPAQPNSTWISSNLTSAVSNNWTSSNSTPGVSVLTSPALVNFTTFYSKYNDTTQTNSSLNALHLTISSSYNQTLTSLFSGNSTLNKTGNVTTQEETPSRLYTLSRLLTPGDALEIEVGKDTIPLLETNSTSNQTAQCSGTLMVNQLQVTITYTMTKDIFELMTLASNATVPAPVTIPPLPACAKMNNDFIPGQETTQEILTATRKIPVAVRPPQSVGPTYNIPTSTGQAAPAQSAADFDHAENPAASSTQGSKEEGTSAGSAPLQQAFALADSVTLSNPSASIISLTDSGSNTASPDTNVVGSNTNVGGSGSNSAGSGSGSASVANSESNDGGSASNVASSGSNTAGTGSNGGQSAGNSVQPAIGKEAPGKDGVTTSEGQTVETDGQTTSVDQIPKGEDQTSDGGQSAPGSSQQAPGQTVSGQSSSEEANTGSQSVNSGTGGSTGSGDQSNAGESAVVGEDSNTVAQTMAANDGGAGPDVDQYAPKAVTVGNVPISIDNAAVIVGSQTINAGSSPTTVIANGQTITVGQSQIIAPGTTIPIEAPAASQAASSVTIGSVPVVLQPSNVVIGSQTFSHGSSAAFAVYGGQTYSWDAKQLVGPGGTMATFPSATAAAPRITAGGQVFSIFSSTLQASGTDIVIPNSPSASPFIYQNQTFAVNPSQLVAPDMSITVPPATAQPTPFVYNGQTFSVDNSQFIAPSATIPLSSGSGTVRYGTTVLTVEQTQVICPSTTIALSSVPQTDSLATPSAVTTGGLTFSLGPAAAVIASSTYSFLPGQAPTTVTDQGQTITLASSGVQFGNVNVPVPSYPSSYSVVTQGDLTFSVAPSAVVFNGQTTKVTPGMAPLSTKINGQEISIGPQGVAIANTTVPLPMVSNPSGYAVVTQGGLTISVAPSAVVLNGQTNGITSGMTPITTAVDGQTISIGPQGVGLASTTIPLPVATNSAGYAVVTQGDLTFSVAPSAVVLDGQTNSIQSGMTPITTNVDGQIVSIGQEGVGIVGTTIPLPTPPPAYAVVSRGDLTFSIAPTEAVIQGSTFAIGPNMTATVVLDGQTISVGPSEVDFPGTTVDIPSATSNQAPAAVTADGLTFSVGPTDAVIGGTTYAIGSGAIAKTVVIGSETIGLGTNGVVLASTTVPPEQTPTAITADGLTFSADATEAIINGTAYAIGSEAIAKTIVYGSETIGLGTKGIVLPSTTIAPWGNATQTSLSSMYAASAAAASSSMSSVSAAAESADSFSTGLPGTHGDAKNDIHRGTGNLLRPPDILILGATLGGLILGLLAIL